MNGILIIDKPVGLTSHDVIGKLRKILKTKRIGHTGTLDPFATGVLVTLIGQATRLAQFLDKDSKEYSAIVKLGYETDTGDFTGTPKSEKGNAKQFTIEEISDVLQNFEGEIKQTPPMYSAKKLAGKKLYELARQGIEVKREAVSVKIHEISAFLLEEPAFDAVNQTFNFGLKVSSSAGTYIRVLAEDIGKSLNTGGHLLTLRRLRAGKFTLENSVTLENLEQIVSDNQLDQVLISMNDAVSHLSNIKLSAEENKKIRQGMFFEFSSQTFQNEELIRLSDEQNNLVAIGYFDSERLLIKPRIVFN